jgi:hypothetical protein
MNLCEKINQTIEDLQLCEQKIELANIDLRTALEPAERHNLLWNIEISQCALIRLIRRLESYRYELEMTKAANFLPHALPGL